MENLKEAYKCCFTGYRPSKFPFSMDKNDSEYLKFENKLIEQILKLANDGCNEFMSGMAIGFDIIAAEAVMLLRNAYPKLNIKLTCVIPFPEQSAAFSDDWKKRYDFLIENSDSTVLICPEYSPGCYQKRNKYMVDNCDCVITWYDGKKGGTKNTVDYALKKGRYVFNINGQIEFESAEQLTFEVL